ncbi:MAG: family 10 glycosylhydrolase [Kiritimatiellaeota bacterium]|nr:family 10 glycosylhydrolase [Kiritimatiellota bacterium]
MQMDTPNRAVASGTGRKIERQALRRIGTISLGALGCLTLLMSGCLKIEPSDETPARQKALVTLRAERREMAHKPRRIIFNNDGNDAFVPAGEPHTRENFLSKRTAPLVGSQVDAIFFCTGVFNLYNHHSSETEPFIIKPRMQGNTRLEDWGWELGRHGPDTLATMVDFGHKHKIEVFWSMRMNDTHDSSDPGVLCQWKREHPDCLMGTYKEKFVAGGNRWSALNYAMPEVREKVVRILRDVATRYDVDGLELDFMRSPVYFKPQMLGKPVTQQQCDLMTDMLRRVRAMADETAAKRGRPMLIAIRVPDSVGFASALGLDVVRWLKEDLVDMMAVSCFFQLNPWETSVQLGHQYGVPVYPSLSEPRFTNGQSQRVRKSPECYRGRALDAWQAGADGIYMFNYFDPRSRLWRELGDRDTLQDMDQLYPAGTMATSMIGWLAGGMQWMNRPMPLPEKPLTITPGGKASIEISVAATVNNQSKLTPCVQARLLVDDVASAKDLTVKLNDQALPDSVPAGAWLEYAVDPSAVKQGVNRLELTMPAAGNGTKLLDAVLQIWYKSAAISVADEFSVEYVEKTVK